MRERLTNEIGSKLVEAIALGADRVQASVYAGVSFEVLRQWIVLGEQGHHPYRVWLRAIERAESARAMRLAIELRISTTTVFPNTCPHCSDMLTAFASTQVAEYIETRDLDALIRAAESWHRIGIAHGVLVAPAP
jgi:hypothetical protein